MRIFSASFCSFIHCSEHRFLFRSVVYHFHGYLCRIFVFFSGCYCITFPYESILIYISEAFHQFRSIFRTLSLSYTLQDMCLIRYGFTLLYKSNVKSISQINILSHYISRYVCFSFPHIFFCFSVSPFHPPTFVLASFGVTWHAKVISVTLLGSLVRTFLTLFLTLMSPA